MLNLLNYIAATRNRDWKQHLGTKEEMAKYFHAHDQLNYAKWVLLYIADMLELETTLSRQILKVFSDTNIKVNNTQKIEMSIRNEKQLYARMLAISRTRPELCPDKVIGDYEFTNIPPSNFMPDGRTKPKSNEELIKMIKRMPKSGPGLPQLIEQESVIIIDAWDLLSNIKKMEPTAKVFDLANLFLSELTTISNNSFEIRLLFHPFVQNSLNESDDHKKNSLIKSAIYYHVTNNTPIKNLDNFLGHLNTRMELATFLAKTAQKHFQESKIRLLVAFENKFAANRPWDYTSWKEPTN